MTVSSVERLPAPPAPEPPTGGTPARSRGTAVLTVASLLAALAWTAVLGPRADIGHLTVFVAGWAFLLGGLLLAWQRPGRFHRLLLGIAAALAVATLELTRVPLLWTLGAALNSLFAFLLVVLVLRFPRGTLDRVDRVLVVGNAVLLLAGASLLAVYDPGALGCGDCPPDLNVVLVRSDPDLLLDGVRVFGLAVAALASAVALRLALRLRSATAPGRRVLAPVAVPAALWFGTHALTRVLRHLADVRWDGYHPSAFVSVALLAMIPFGVLIGVLRSRARRVRVGDLIVELGGGPTDASLRAAVARTLGDPSAEVGFWVAETGRYVSAVGEPLRLPAAGSGRAVAYAHGSGQPLVAVVHDEALLDEPRLVDSVAAAARLAVENQRLHAELVVKLEEVRASRARLVEAGDVERRRIERNLHDGAQQQLLALALRLRGLAQQRPADDPLRPALEDAVGHARRALEELRELARGLHPSLLTDEGLGAALEELAERSPLPVVLDLPASLAEAGPGGTGGLPEPVEAAAYYVVAEGLTNAVRHSGAQQVRVGAEVDGGVLRLRVEDDGRGGADLAAGTGLRGLRDRVEAAGGTLRLGSPPGAGTRLVAEFPCG